MEIVAAIQGVQSGNKPVVMKMGKSADDKIELWVEDKRGQICGNMHVFSQNQFSEFFTEALANSPEKMKFPANSRTRMLESLIKSLPSEEIGNLNLDSEVEEKMKKVVDFSNRKSKKKLEALERIWSLEQPFLAREFKENTHYTDAEAQSLLQSLKNQGFLKNSKVEHPEDGRINYEYRISQKAEDYINHFSER
ncbi:MAG: hypothetical protein ABEK16_04630 [Candidatus Nanohalobium sp.]